MRLYMRILRLAVLPRSHVRTTQLTLCINDTFAQYVKLLLLLLVQTKTLPKMYLIFLQPCIDSDSIKLHCNTLSTLKSSQPEKSHPVTNISAISYCCHRSASLGMLLVALPIDWLIIPRITPVALCTLSPARSIVAFNIPIEKIRVLSSISHPTSPSTILILSTKRLAQLAVEIAETGMRRMKYRRNEGRLRGTLGRRWCRGRVMCAG
jgi:hypothetical protein